MQGYFQVTMEYLFYEVWKNLLIVKNWEALASLTA